MTQRLKHRRYYLELGAAMFAYVLLLAGALHVGRKLPHGPVQVAVFLSPMVAVAAAAWAIVRQVRRSDEFIRKTTLEDIAIAAAVTAVLSVAYGFLENAGLPRLTMFAVWPVMAMVWIMAGLARGLCRR